MLFRPMEEKDLDSVVEIEKANFSSPWSKNSFLESLHNTYSRFYVAFENEVVGYCGIHNFGGDGEITNVAVDEKFRKNKIAFTLLSYAMEDWKKDGVESFTLEVRVSNLPAIALYEKLGFQNQGVRKNFYDNPKEDALIMWKN